MQPISFTTEIQTDAYLILEYGLCPLHRSVFPVGKEAMYDFHCVSEYQRAPSWWQLTRLLETKAIGLTFRTGPLEENDILIQI